MSPKGLSFHSSSKTFPQLSHFQSSRLLGSLDFLQIFPVVPIVAASVVNSGWVQFCIVSFRMSSAESTVLCFPTIISCDCEVERTIINGWMQDKCGKFMQISIRSHLCGAVQLCVFYWCREKTLSLPCPFYHVGTHFTWTMPLTNGELNNCNEKEKGDFSFSLAASSSSWTQLPLESSWKPDAILNRSSCL